MTVTAEIMRLHLSIDGNDYDVLLMDLIEAAAEKASHDCQGRYENDEDAPARFKQCIKLLVADWFLNREATVDGKRGKNPVGYEWLMASLRSGASYV